MSIKTTNSINEIFQEAEDEIYRAGKLHGSLAGVGTAGLALLTPDFVTSETALGSAAMSIFLTGYGMYMKDLSNRYFYERQIYDRVIDQIGTLIETKKSGDLKEKDIPTYFSLYFKFADEIKSAPPKEKLKLTIPFNKKTVNLGIVIATTLCVLANINSAWEHYESGNIIENRSSSLSLNKNQDQLPKF